MVDTRDFRISVQVRADLHLFTPVFPYTEDPREFKYQAQDIASRFNQSQTRRGAPSDLSAARLYASAILHLMYQAVISHYLHEVDHDLFSRMVPFVQKNREGMAVLDFYSENFPSPLLHDTSVLDQFYLEETSRGFFVHQVLNNNPALVKAIRPFISPEGVVFPDATQALAALIGGISQSSAQIKNQDTDLFTFLTTPARLHPDSLSKQITYILNTWKEYLPDTLRSLALRGLDYMSEEDRPHHVGPGVCHVPDYFGSGTDSSGEYEAFSQDRNWMPNVVMMAKSTLVWLDQLSKEYKRPITTLDAIPDKELDTLVERGFTALWLIGLWERSSASKKIKNICGNPDAEASAYSLKNYDIASSIGGWKALENLSDRCRERGLRLASDMVPNHTGIDSDWMLSHPEYFISQDYAPFPSYSFEGEDLTPYAPVEIKIEDHYFDKTDAAVTFRRRDRTSGRTDYVFHGNDGTSMPWNDTAQINFLNPEAREAVIQQILHVARAFPIIRFDAAMTLARKHIQRLWYPVPGHGGDIAGRADHALSQQAFDAALPQEFWREVVDRVGQELPDTLLLAEAFWMMEGYFVRTLGMHRVYNSAFMNMLKNEDNKKYRDTIKNTILFDPEILKRYVNFMNNPDEETAYAQFGDGDKYIGVCTLLSTMPGLPMFGHGQIEGYREKYGMEYRQAYWDEKPHGQLVRAHEQKIFPLLRMRHFFSGVDKFQLFDFMDNGNVQESVFAYVNGDDSLMTLVVYNNQYQGVSGTISKSAPRLYRNGNGERHTASTTLADALGLTMGGRHFLLYKDFSSGLTHLMPSIRVFDEGLWFALSGYQTSIFLELREVEDSDGAYERLYDMLGGRGVEDIEKELAALRLTPVYRTMEPLRDKKVWEALSSLTQGTLAKKDERALLLYLGEAYMRITAVTETLSPAARDVLPTVPRDVSAQEVMGIIQSLNGIFSSESMPVFRYAGFLRQEYPLVLASMLFLLPFMEETPSPDSAIICADKLLLDRFFKKSLPHLNLDALEIKRLCHEGALCAALISSCSWLFPPGYTAHTVLSSLLGFTAFRDLVGCNEYQGVVWYRKEVFQDILVTVMTACSAHLEKSDGPDGESLLSELLSMERSSGYRIDGLLSQ